MQPVSVVIPTYNRASMIRRGVDSVLAGIEPGDEIVVIDDGSTDDTDRVLATTYGDKIRYVRAKNGGAGAARNRGVAEAKHAWVAFCDSDDEWFPDRLVLGRRLLEKRPDILFCFSDFGLRQEGQPDGHGGLAGWHHDPRSWDDILGRGVPYSTIAELPPNRADFLVHVGDLYPNALERSYVAVQTMLVRRDQAGPALRFAEDVTYEDWECAGRLARVGKAAYLSCETALQWGHNLPRVSDGDAFAKAHAQLTIIDRIWASDPEFNARHPGRVQRRVQQLELICARSMLRRGRNADARAAFRRAGAGLSVEGLLAMMPTRVTRDLFAAAALVRRVLR